MNTKVVINRDVIIDELKEWDWTKNINKDSMRNQYEEPASEVVINSTSC